MIARHTLTYVGSRGLAAILNLASVAVFTRLAPVESYGAYLYVMSWALVLYGATCQWPKYAFFALYDEARATVQVATLARILAGTVVLASLGSGLAAASGLVPARMAGAVIAIVLGITLFEASAEVARTRLRAGTVAVAVVARAVLVLGLGSAALHLSQDPLHLALAVAAANAVAALPAVAAVLPLMGGRGSRVEAGRLLAYGWPLALSFGTAALAASLDRLIIGRTVGPEELGAYGAIADFLKQSFVVFGEALTLSMIPIAKREARLGGWPAASAILADAARAIALLAAFGAVFFCAFDDVVIAILLGPDYRAEAQRLAPVLILASILMTLRAHYFGQVIYFARTSRLELAASVAALVTVAGLALLLIPTFGVMGAAAAFAAGQGAACLVFILGARWRAEGAIAMPLPGADILGIAGGALACALLLWAIGLTPWGYAPAGQALRFVLLVAGFVAVAWRYDVVGVARAVRGRLFLRTR